MKALILLAALTMAASATAADKKMDADKAAAASAMAAGHVMLKPEDLKWGKGPDMLPAGIEAAVLNGDPGKEGNFVMRGRMPANYKIPPHTHPTTENVTVISGELMLGMGKKFDESKMTKLGPGSYVSLPSGMAHYAMSKSGTEIQIEAMGPFAIDYINPKDDPRKAGGTTLK
jgi:quercetin dioxygenase-like cupin family protein